METLTININLSSWELIPYQGKSENSKRYKVYVFLCFTIEIWLKAVSIIKKEEDIY